MIKTVEEKLVPIIREQLNSFAEALSAFSVNFTVFTLKGDVLLHNSSTFTTDCKELFEAVKNFADSDNTDIFNKITAMGTIYPVEIDLGIDEKVIAVIETDTHDTDKLSAIGQMLCVFAKTLAGSIKTEHQIEMVSTELAETYEELVLLYKMSSNMKVTQADSNYLQLACDSLTEIVNVEGIAILIKKNTDGQKKLVLTAGAGLIEVNSNLIEQLQVRLAEELQRGREALLDSEVDSPFRYDWPERMRNIIAVPLQSNDKTTGMLIAINRIDKPDFDSTDVKLFNSVAHQCAVFIENGNLFCDLKELFVGTLRALTTSIDAKDQYTRGHSERVAFVAKWITEKLSETEDIDQEYIHRIYLAGLLHDIGKIGINESVLRKKGSLTEDEMNQIKSHPSIGASILSEIKQMNDIIPGILCHHERIDGKGYPDGLEGDKIPLIGKILSVADAFDAMTSRRTYRNAMSLDDALAEIKKGIGTQFDEKVGTAFLQSDIYSLWDIIQQNGNSAIWNQSDVAEYSTVAVGALIK